MYWTLELASKLDNTDNKLVKNVLEDSEATCAADLTPLELTLSDLEKRHEELHKAQDGKKDDEIATADKDALEEVEKKMSEERAKKDSILSDYAGKNSIIHQLVDLALLQNNMLKGEALTNFVKRSVEMI